MLTPPKLSEEQSLVYEALTKETGKNISLVFPESGELRSSYIFADFDGDNEDEAGVFYRNAESGDKTVRFNILDIEDGEWRSMYDISGNGDLLNEVIVSRLGNFGKNYICVLYGISASESSVLEIYSYENKTSDTIFSENVFKFFVSDYDGNEDFELCAVKTGNENTEPSVFIAKETEKNKIEKISSVRLVGEYSEIRNITNGYVGENTPALFIDEAMTSGGISTEIVYSIGGTLRNPCDIDGSTILDDTNRTNEYYSIDCDGDNITEIPITEICPGYENASEKLYLTKWCTLYNYEITEKYKGFYNISQGYAMMFPGRWEGLISTGIDSLTGAVVFYRYDGTIDEGNELLRIITSVKSDSEEYLNSGWEVITEDEDNSYLVKLVDNTEDPLVLTITEVKNNFYVTE